MYISEGCKALTAFAVMSLYCRCDFHTAEQADAENVLQLKTKVFLFRLSARATSSGVREEEVVVFDQWQVLQNLVQRY